MLCVETIGKIRRRRLVQGESISAIARDLGLSRNTVKRALRSEGERSDKMKGKYQDVHFASGTKCRFGTLCEGGDPSVKVAVKHPG